MKGIAYKLGLVFTLSLLNSCNKQQTLSPIEYVEWIKNEENGLNASKIVNDLEFLVQYKPLEFIVAQEEKTATLSNQLLENRKKELGANLIYFNFRIKNQKGNLSPIGSNAYSEQEYQKRLAYFTFDMQDDLYLLNEQDTLPCTLYQFVQNYDIAPYVDFVLGFSKKNEKNLKGDVTFIFDDQVLKTGKTQLLFKKNIFENIPKIKTL